VLEFVSSISIGDKSRVCGNERVGTSSKISDMFIACIEVLESTIELCIVGDDGKQCMERNEKRKLNLVLLFVSP
jgi:hypothetical protein